MHSQHRGVEQLVARRAHNPEVGGPSPPSATKQEVNPNGWPLIVFPPHVSSHHIQQPLTHLFKHRNSETNIQAQLTAHLFAHKKPDFVLGKRGIGIGKHNRTDAYRKRGLPANHRARFQNANTL